MSELNYRAPPMSRAKIRGITNQIRKRFNLNMEYIPIVSLFEFGLQYLAPDFSYHIAECSELGQNHGLTQLDTKEIIIRRDVYEGAIKGVGRDRLTIAHEIGHAMLHPKSGLARQFGNYQLRAFEDPEWQAKCFSGELLMNPALITIKDTRFGVADRFGVSMSAAEIQLEIYKKEGLLK